MWREVQDCSIVETAEVISWAREVRVEVDMMDGIRGGADGRKGEGGGGWLELRCGVWRIG